MAHCFKSIKSINCFRCVTLLLNVVSYSEGDRRRLSFEMGIEPIGGEGPPLHPVGRDKSGPYAHWMDIAALVQGLTAIKERLHKCLSVLDGHRCARPGSHSHKRKATQVFVGIGWTSLRSSRVSPCNNPTHPGMGGMLTG